MHRFPGFAISGYRSLMGDPQWIPLSAKTTVILGSNNSGKSNVIRLVHGHMAEMFKVISNAHPLARADFRQRLDGSRGADEMLVRVHWPVDHERIESEHPDLMDRLSVVPMLTQFGGVVTIPLVAENFDSPLVLRDELGASVTTEAPGVPWQDLSQRLTNTTGGAFGGDALRFLQWLSAKLAAPPATAYVPPSRSVKPGSTEDWDFGGQGIIERLQRIAYPEFDEDHHRRQAIALRDDLRFVLEDEALEFEVPYDRSTINVRLGGEFFPLASLGTGTEHAVLILAALHVFPERLLCLEEPDAHFHPRLQRRLMSVLRDRAETGVVIATHSAHVIDTTADTVISVAHASGRSTLTQVGDPTLFAQLRALGYRASDLLQADAVIWVEGPSDRLYLLHWLKAAAPDLQEGVDFSIVFYGGALVRRLSARLPSPVEPTLVDLWRVNQRVWLVMDSDKGRGALRHPVKRLSHELRDAGRSGTWITKGHTVENYIPPDLLLEAVKEVYPTVVSIENPQPDRDPLRSLIRKNGEPLKSVDKVAIATAVTARPAALEVLDLQLRLRRLTAFLRSVE